jgi:hypothetical protein
MGPVRWLTGPFLSGPLVYYLKRRPCEMKKGLIILDYLFHIVHLSVLLICILGWVYQPFRAFHQLVVALVAISWLGLGLKFGFRYCVLTDTQWRIKRRLGREPYTTSYVKYILDKITGSRIDKKVTDRVTLYTYACVVAITLVVDRVS